MLLLACLLNLVINGVIAIFVLFVVGYMMSFFWPGMPSFYPWGSPQPQSNRVVSALYFLIGFILLINFVMCIMSGGSHEVFPPLWHP